jgi:hypothetical protein
MNRFVHGRIGPLSELRKSSTATPGEDADATVGRLAVWLCLLSTVVYYLSSHGVANYFRWLLHAAGKAAP